MGLEQDVDKDDHVVVNSMPVDFTEGSELLPDGSKDSKGNIAKRDKTGGWRTAPLVFGPETCEKLAVVGIVINFVPYLTGSLHLTSSAAANLVTTYQGTSYMLTLVGGFMADAFLGRYWVIVGSATVQFFGLLLLTLSTVLPMFKPKPCSADSVCSSEGMALTVIYLSVYLIAVGTGGIKATASAFGADQFDPNHNKEKKNLAGFFSWYFFGISCGAFVAVTILVWVQDNKGRTFGYLIPTVTMLAVILLFVAGRTFYRYKEPKGSPITQILQVFVSAYHKRKLQLPAESEKLFELDKVDQPYDYVRVERSNQFKFLDKAAIVEKASSTPERSRYWILNTVTRVEETKMVLRLLPIVITTSIFYTVYAQMTTFSTEQGSTMYRKIGSFEFPAASMAAFLHLSILLSLYLWEKLVVPIASRFTGNEKGTSSLQRIGLGLAISILGMTVAALVERRRLTAVESEHFRALLAANPHASLKLSIFWLLPQYVLVGVGESLTYAGQLDFFYNESPKAMRSMGSALCICTLSAGYYTSSLLVSVVNGISRRRDADGTTSAWLQNVTVSGRLDCFYWLLALFSLINFLLFLGCGHWYKYKAIIDSHWNCESKVGSEKEEFQATDVELNEKGEKVTGVEMLVGVDEEALNQGDDHGRQNPKPESENFPTHTRTKSDSFVQADKKREGPAPNLVTEENLPHHRRQRSSRPTSFTASPDAEYYLTKRYSP